MSTGTQAIVRPEVLQKLELSKTQLEGRLPAWMTAGRFMYGIATAIQKNPALLNCDPNSVLLAAYEAAECGCDLSPSRQLGWLIPYGRQAQFQPSYRHFIQQAYRSGVVKSLFAECVYAGDRFRLVFAPQRTLQHEPAVDEHGIPLPESMRGQRRGAYALIEFTDGHFDFVYCDEELIAKHRQHSKQPDSLMWKSFPNEGACKTAIRLLFKRLPEKNEALARVAESVERDSETDRAEPIEPGKIEFQAPLHPEPENGNHAAEMVTYKGKLYVRWGTGEEEGTARMKPDTIATFQAIERRMKQLATFLPTAREWVVAKERVHEVNELAEAEQLEWVEQ